MPFALNFVIGFGIGSWVQGDNSGGRTGTLGSLIGITLSVVGYNTRSTTISIMGGLLTFGSWVIGILRPFQYGPRYNSKLKNALGLNPISCIEILPKVDIANNGYVIPGVAFQICF